MWIVSSGVGVFRATLSILVFEYSKFIHPCAVQCLRGRHGTGRVDKLHQMIILSSPFICMFCTVRKDLSSSHILLGVFISCVAQLIVKFHLNMSLDDDNSMQGCCEALWSTTFPLTTQLVLIYLLLQLMVIE